MACDSLSFPEAEWMPRQDVRERLPPRFPLFHRPVRGEVCLPGFLQKLVSCCMKCWISDIDIDIGYHISNVDIGIVLDAISTDKKLVDTILMPGS